MPRKPAATKKPAVTKIFVLDTNVLMHDRSFPPYSELHAVGSRENYFIHDGYQHRGEYLYYDDRTNSEGWQDEVYRFAREVADEKGLKSVVDIGCGSGYKLLKYFKDFDTLGLDVVETFEALQRRYPSRRWGINDFAQPVAAQVVISADVIEHLLNPDKLLEYIVSIRPTIVVLSTPDRNLMRMGSHNGPPCNPNHIREWGMAEFHAYVSHYFTIVEHFHSNSGQWTQCVMAKLKS